MPAADLGDVPGSAHDLLPNGTLAKHTDRVFADLRGTEPGVPDGMKVGVGGHVYCGGAGGIWIMDQRGNLAFGGDDWRTLYVTTRAIWAQST